MFAYVKFCLPDNGLCIVKTSQIGKFKIPFEKNKKYKVTCDDSTVKKAVVIYAEDIFEYYLKTNKQLIGSNLLSERDTYEDIRAKISDLLRPPKTSKPKVLVPPKPKESSSSSYESSVGSEDEKSTEEETQKEDAAKESNVE